MSIKTALIDTGPLVALLHADDPMHRVCDEIANSIRLPLRTCLPVITEAAYLLRRNPQIVQTLLTYCGGSILEVVPLAGSDFSSIARILLKYSDQKFDLADAAMMHLAERDNIPFVFTLDHRHFGVYRTAAGKPLTLSPTRVAE